MVLAEAEAVVLAEGRDQNMVLAVAALGCTAKEVMVLAALIRDQTMEIPVVEDQVALMAARLLEETMVAVAEEGSADHLLLVPEEQFALSGVPAALGAPHPSHPQT